MGEVGAQCEVDLMEDGLVDVAEAAKFLRVSRAKLYLMMDAREIPFCKFGKSRRIPRRALIEYAKRCLVVAGNEAEVVV
jgi:excisionase family DNA binding protein